MNNPEPPRSKTGPPRRTDWQQPFLEALSLHGIQTRAAKQANVDPTTVRVERVRDEDFAVRYADALEEAADNLETFAHRWATTGLESRTTTTRYDGAGLAVESSERVESSVSPTLLIFLLKAARPGKYRENVRVEQTGPGGGPMRVVIDDERISREVTRLLGELESRG